MKVVGIQQIGDTFVVRVFYQGRTGTEVFDHIYLKPDGKYNIRFDYQQSGITSDDILEYLEVMNEAKRMIADGKFEIMKVK